MSDLEQIKKLRPQERIKRLKALQTKRKEEEEEAEKMLAEAEKDLKKQSIIEEIEVPGAEDKDIAELFETQEDTLENTIEGETPPKVKGVVYQLPHEVENEIHDLYSQLSDLSYNTNWSEEDFENFYETTDRLREINDQFEEKIKNGYTLSESVTSQLVASQSVEYNIRKYREFGK